MARKLPPKEDGEKRRRQIFKRVYQHLEHWDALREDRGMGDVIPTDEGEDIFRGDLMIGYETLPPRQQQAFTLICLKGYTETAARDELLPNSKSSTPVQQYADSGLIRMIAAYDLKQSGQWPPVEAPPKKKTKTKRRPFFMPTTLHPLVREGLEATLKKVQREIDSLLAAKAQLEAMLGLIDPPADDAPEVKEAAPTQPAPNPAPQGKPRLEDMARELAAVGTTTS